MASKSIALILQLPDYRYTFCSDRLSYLDERGRAYPTITAAVRAAAHRMSREDGISMWAFSHARKPSGAIVPLAGYRK